MSRSAEDIQKTFDLASEGYDRPGLAFFQRTARRLVQEMALRGDERLLDVATGTGAVALEAARMLPQGQVVGVDLSPGMLAQARRKAQEAALANVTFLEGNVLTMDLPQGPFQGVTCSFALFFFPDMVAAVSRFAQLLAPGSPLWITAPAGMPFPELSALAFARLKTFGIEPAGDSHWLLLDSEEKQRAVLAQGGLHGFQHRRLAIAYDLAHAEQWWDLLWFSGFRGLLAQLTPENLHRFRQEHLEEVAAVGLRLELEMILSCGVRALA